MIDNINDIQILTVNDDNHYLNNACDKVKSIEEGKEIANTLFQVLNRDGRGIGLAANQIGIHKQVCVVNVREPLYFINPVITPIESEGTFVYLETCLSMPMQVVRTERWKSIAVQADNIEGTVIYDITHISQDDVMESNEALEMAAIQHEIDHLKGLLMIHRKYNIKPIQVGRTIGRNDKILIKKGNESKEIKYKSLEVYTNEGWIYEKI